MAFAGSCSGAAGLALNEAQVVERDDDASHLEVELEDGSTFSVECASYLYESGKIAGTSLDVPVFRLRCGRPQRNSGTAIWVFGGPFAKFGDGLLPEQVLLLELGYDLIVPMYPGSAERKYQVVDGRITPGLQTAFAELSELIAASQRLGHVLLVGESFGALLALQSAKLLRSEDRLMLAGPMLVTFRDAMAINGDPASRILDAQKKENDLALHLKEGTSFSIGNRSDPAHVDKPGVTNKASTRDEVAIAVNFMQDWLHTRPVTNFENPNGAQVLILAGDRDPFVKKEYIDELTDVAGPNVATILLPGQEHGGVRTLQEIELLRNYLLPDKKASSAKGSTPS